MNHIWTLILVLSVAIAGAKAGEAAAVEETGVPVSETAERVSSRLQTVYEADAPRFTKQKAHEIHDRVTIRVNKQADAKLEATTELEKESDLTSTVTNWFTIAFDNGELVAKPRTGTKLPNADVEYEGSHAGEGETERKQTITNEISGEVIDVRPNGHLVIAARTSIRVNEETETVVLTGRVDPADLNADSIVDADRIIELTYRVDGKGEVTDNIKRGWGKKLFDKLNPF